MLNFWSSFEEAWRDTLIHKAEGTALADRARQHSFPWPKTEVSEGAWRGALHANSGYARRGSLAVAYWALEAALSDYNTVISCTVGAAGLKRVRPADYDDTVFIADHVNRLVRTKYGLHWSIGPSSIVDGQWLELSPYSCTYWDAFPELDEGTELEIQILPFVLRERTPGEIDATGDTSHGTGCQVEVELHAATLARIPATYMQEQAESHVVTADTGTERLTFLAAHGRSVGDRVMVYVQRSTIAIPAGTDAVPAPLTNGGVYYVKTVPTATTMTLSATNGGAQINLTTTGSGDIYVAFVEPYLTPVTMPLNGQLLENEEVLGNPNGDGPFPAYLFDGTLFIGLLTALDRTLAAGVSPIVGWCPILPHTGLSIADVPPLF